MKLKKQKLSTGGKIKNYMKNPSSVLQQNQIDLATAKKEGNADPLANILGAVGNLAMQYGISQGGLNELTGDGEGNTTTEMGNTLMPMLANLSFGLGGKVPNVPIEAEGNEVVQTPEGDVGVLDGPSHENGGIDLMLPEGTEIFSDRLVGKDGLTMAERKINRENKLSKIQGNLDKTPTDRLLKKSLQRLKEINKKEEEQDLAQMEKAREAYNSGIQFMMGGEIEKYFNGGEVKKKGGIFKDISPGDMIGLAGTLYSTFAGSQNTQANRAGDTPNINAFENFGEDALETIEDSKSYIETQQDNALKDIELQRNTATRRNRNSARGVNTQRALDLATDNGTNAAKEDVFDTFSKQMMSILSQQAGLENQQDQVVMTGEQNRDNADRMDRDNYFSQMAQDIATKGEGIQTIGKMLNQSKKNKISEEAINSMSKHGFTLKDGVMYDSNGNPATEAQQKKIANENGFKTYTEFLNSIKED